jgi:cytochrome c-type biogenesis protein CcmH/NrfF
MVSNCNKFHYISKGDTCSQIYNYEKISLADFVKWNPSVKDDCSGLWAEVYVCVGVIGGAAPTTVAPSTTTKATTTTSAGNGVTTPTPTQPGMVGNCAKFHWVSQGTTCNQILSYNKISLTDFATWNPSVKADCSGLWAEVNVCVGLIGGSLTTTAQPTTTQPTTTVGNGIATPTPIQPGMVSNCKKFHYVSEGDACSQITSYEKITLADFIKWNTGVGSTCSNMWSKAYVCVGI